MVPPALGAADHHPPSAKHPNACPPLEYPNRFEVRSVSANGGIRWHHQGGNVSPTGVGAHVGLEDIGESVWNVSVGPLKLGRLHERHLRLEDAYGRLTRLR
jgi:putative transposase